MWWIASRVLSHHCLSTSLLLIQATHLTVRSQDLALVQSFEKERRSATRGLGNIGNQQTFHCESSATVPSRGLRPGLICGQNSEMPEPCSSSRHYPTLNPHAHCCRIVLLRARGETEPRGATVSQNASPFMLLHGAGCILSSQSAEKSTYRSSQKKIMHLLSTLSLCVLLKPYLTHEASEAGFLIHAGPSLKIATPSDLARSAP